MTAVAADDGFDGWRRKTESLGRVCGVSPAPPRVEYRRTQNARAAK
jgi:hypothetical protein